MKVNFFFFQKILAIRYSGMAVKASVACVTVILHVIITELLNVDTA